MNPAPKASNLESYVGRVAAHIRKLRIKAGLSVPEFAEQLGKASGEPVAVKTVYSWEVGNRSPQLSMLPFIAEALGIAKVRNVLPPE